jgi:hypothetical protein
VEDQSAKAKIRQLLHVLDEMTAAANEQQTLFLLNKLTDLPENAYEAVETLKMPFVESRRGRPHATKRLSLAVERSSKEYKKEKNRKLAIAKKQKDVVSRNLQSTDVEADAAMIVDLTKHARLHLEKIVNGTIASDIPSYLPHGRSWKSSILSLTVIAASELWPKKYMAPKRNGNGLRMTCKTCILRMQGYTKKSMALTILQ